MKFVKNMSVKPSEQKQFTPREIILAGLAITAFPLLFTFGGRHPFIYNFTDPTTDHIMPYVAAVLIYGTIISIRPSDDAAVKYKQ